jgi:flagellar basal-body rod protein FlgF
MIRGLYTSSAGMQVEQLRTEAISNNLANANTAGFRRDMAIVEARRNMKLSRTDVPTSGDPLATSKRVPVGNVGIGVFVNRMVKDFQQGDLKQTDNPFDLGLHGQGFMTVQAPDGATLYSRDGQFTRTKEGFVTDKTGCKLMGLNGPIVANGKFEVTIDGQVSIGGKPTDRLALVDFDKPDEVLAKHGDTQFQAINGTPKPATKLEVNQGSLEGANVNSVQEMVTMITALREYEANQKAIQAQDETLGRAVNDIAK